MRKPLKIVSIVAVVLVLLLVVAWFVAQALAPGIIRSEIQTAVRQNSGMDIEIGRITLRGLSGMTLRDVRLVERLRPEIEVAYMERVVVALDGIPLPGRPLPDISSVHVVRPRAVIVTEPDGTLNLSRLLVPEEPPEPPEEPLVIHRITVEGADLRYVDQREGDAPAIATAAGATPAAADRQPTASGERDSGTASAESSDEQLVRQHLEEINEEDNWPRADLLDVNLEARLTDPERQAYQFNLAIGGGTLGAGAIEGSATLDPPGFDLRSTDPFKPTATTLAGIPGIAEDLLRQLSPVALIHIDRLALTGDMNFPVADIRLTEGAVTPPGLPRVDDITLLAALAENGNGRLVLTEAQTDGAIIEGEILLENLDRWGEAQRAEGRIMLQRYPLAPDVVPGLLLSGRLDIGYDAAVAAEGDGAAPGRQLALFEFVGEIVGGAQTEQPLRVPVALRLAADDDAAAAAGAEDGGFVNIADRFAVSYAIGGNDHPINLRGLARVNMPERTIAINQAAPGHIDFTAALLAQAAGVEPARLAELDPRGRITVNLSDTIINLDDPLESIINIVVAGRDLRFSVPQTREQRRLAFEARVASVPDDPDIRYRAVATASEIGSRGALEATAVMAADGRSITGQATLTDLPLPADIFLALQPTVAQRIDRLAGVLSGRVSGSYDIQTGQFADYQGRLRLANGRATVLLTPDAPLDVALTAEANLEPDEITATADVSGMDGTARLSGRWTPQRTTAALETLRGREFDISLLPQAIRDMLGPTVPSRGRIAFQSSAAGRTPRELLAKVPIRFRIVNTEIEVPSAEQPVRLQADLEGSADVNLIAGSVAAGAVSVTRLVDAQGGLFMPPGASLLVQIGEFTFADLPQSIRASLRDWPGMTAEATASFRNQRLLIERARLDAQLNRTDWRRMAAPLRAAAPAGSVTFNLSAAREADGTWSAVDGRMQLVDLSWAVDNLRAPPLTAVATATRQRRGEPLEATIFTDDADYGKLDIRLAQAGDNRANLSAAMTRFNFSRQLSAMIAALSGSPALIEMQPSGIFDGEVSGLVQLDPLQVIRMSGDLVGEQIAATPAGLPIERGTMRASATNQALTLDSFEAVAGRGSLTAKGIMRFRENLPFSGTAEFRDIDLRTMRQVRNLHTDQLSGMLRGNVAEFSGFAVDPVNTLQARGELSFYDGYFWPLPLFDVLQGRLQRQLAGLLRNQFDPTAFRAAHLIYTVDEATLQIRESYFDSNAMRLVMDGDIHFDGRLDLHAASAINLPFLDNRLPQLDPRAGDALDILRGLPGVGLPATTTLLRITGTFDEPRPAVDTRRIFARLPQQMQLFLNRETGMADIAPHVFAEEEPPAAEPEAAPPPAEQPAPDQPAPDQPAEQPPPEQPAPDQPAEQPPADQEEPSREERREEALRRLLRNIPLPLIVP